MGRKPKAKMSYEAREDWRRSFNSLYSPRVMTRTQKARFHGKKPGADVDGLDELVIEGITKQIMERRYELHAR